MKTTKYIVAFTLLSLIGFAAQAQSDGLKIGYTNIDYILSKMPEAKQIQSELKTHEDQLGTQLQGRMKEFEDKYKVFMEGQEDMNEVVRNDKQTELQELQSSIQKFQQEAEKSLQAKQVELLKPAYEKIQTVIDEVAKENGFTHIFSNDAAGAPILLFAPEENDISKLVLAKMGVSNDN